MKLTEQAQARIRRCVDNLIDEKTGMSKSQIYGYCTNLEKAGKLDDTGHWGKDDMTESDIIDALKFEQFADVTGLPIFRAGSYHDGKSQYTDADIDAMPAAFNATKEAFKRPVKLSHKGKENPLSFGAIDRVYSGVVNGVKTVMADLRNVPQQFADWIRGENLLGHSVEIYKQFQGHPNVIRGIAFLGADVPEVKGLTDNLAAYIDMDEEPDHITIEFTEINAALQGAGDNNAGAVKADTQSTVTTQTQKESPSKMEPFKTFASKEEFDAYNAAFVPKAELERLQQERDAERQRVYFAEIDSKVAGLTAPNDSKKALPPFVVAELAPILKSIPQTIQFGEGATAKTAVDSIIELFGKVGKVGMVDFAEHIKQTKSETKGEKTAAEKAFEEGLESKLFAETDRADFIANFNAKQGG